MTTLWRRPLLFRAALACKHLERYVFASSYLVYDPSLYLKSAVPESARLLKEGDPLDPRNVCGAAKLLHERELELAAAGRFGICNARIFRVYGRGSRDVVSRWVRSAIQGETIELFDSGGMLDYIFADDAAEGLLRLAKSEAEGVVNLGSGAPRSVATVLECITEATDGVTVVDHGRSERLIEASGAEVSLLQRCTGWVPPTKLNWALRISSSSSGASRRRHHPTCERIPHNVSRFSCQVPVGRSRWSTPFNRRSGRLPWTLTSPWPIGTRTAWRGWSPTASLTEPTIDEASDARARRMGDQYGSKRGRSSPRRGAGRRWAAFRRHSPSWAWLSSSLLCGRLKSALTSCDSPNGPKRWEFRRHFHIDGSRRSDGDFVRCEGATWFG